MAQFKKKNSSFISNPSYVGFHPLSGLQSGITPMIKSNITPMIGVQPIQKKEKQEADQTAQKESTAAVTQKKDKKVLHNVSEMGNVDMSDTRIHYNSKEPERYNAEAIAEVPSIENNSIRLIGSDFRDGIAIIDHEKQTIVISTTVYVTGNGATQSVVDKANEIAKNSPTGTYTFGEGDKVKTYSISFDINYVYESDTENIELKDGENMFNFNNTDERAAVIMSGFGSMEKGDFQGFTGNEGSGGVKDSNKNRRSDDELGNTLIHETFHFLGLSDRYSDDGKVLNGQSIQHESYENDRMGDSQTNGFSQSHFDNIGKHFVGKESGSHSYDDILDKDGYGRLVPPSTIKK